MNFKYIFSMLLLGISLSICSQTKIVILATNDTHSRIEPLPNSDKKYAGMAGVSARAAFIDQVRRDNENVLLLDAGDFLQGTPYFNLFHGRVEAEAMDLMKYDVGTIGNHEFDYGLDTLKMIFNKLDYPIVCCNYDFTNTTLKKEVKPYVILNKFGLKIGIIGVGADPEGLVQKDKYEGMVFKPIISSVNFYAKILKEDKKCDLIICLSHIGYSKDLELAKESKYVDIIIGGHSHTYMEKPEVLTNLEGKDVMVFQTGKNGAYINKFEVELEKKK